jgi:hypothetical protein
VELVQCVGCLQNQLKRKFTVRNQMFGCLELLVIENLCESGFVLTKFEFLFLIDWLIEMMKLFWFDWFEKCMKLLQDVNLILTKILQQFTLKSGSNWNELFSLWFVFQFQFECDELFINWNLFQNTETKDWHQKFLQIVLRNLLNWWKCVGRKILNNVLYPFFILTSFHNISLFVFVCDWFDSTLISFLLNTKWHWNEMDWKNIWKIWFDLLILHSNSFFWNTHSEFWNDLWDVETLNCPRSQKIRTFTFHSIDTLDLV